MEEVQIPSSNSPNLSSSGLETELDTPPPRRSESVMQTQLAPPGGEAHSLSIIVHGRDHQVEVMEELPSHTMSCHHRIIVFKARSSSFRSLDDGEETSSRASNPVGKTVLTLSIPITAALLAYKDSLAYSEHTIILPLVATTLCAGYAATLNGILMRILFPKTGFADFTEVTGQALLLVAIYGTLALLLPANLIWISFVGFGLSFLALLLAFFKVILNNRLIEAFFCKLLLSSSFNLDYDIDV